MKTLMMAVGGLLVLTVACDSDDSGASGAAPSSSGSPQEAECKPGTVWNASSASIRLQGGGYFSKPAGYEADRTLLSAAQLEALDRLCVVPTPDATLSDATFYRIEITDRDGNVKAYRSADYPGVAPEEGESAKLPTLAIRSVSAFRNTYRCLRTPVGPIDQAWLSANALTTDPGCTNLIFMPRNCEKVAISVRIDAPGTYTFRTSACRGNLKIALSSESQLLTSSAEATAESCPTLTHQFDAAGTYRLEASADTGCSEHGGSDLALRVSSP